MTIRRRRALPARRAAHGQPRRQAGQHAVVAIPYCPAGPSTRPQLHRDDRDPTEGNQPQRARAPDPPLGAVIGRGPPAEMAAHNGVFCRVRHLMANAWRNSTAWNRSASNDRCESGMRDRWVWRAAACSAQQMEDGLPVVEACVADGGTGQRGPSTYVRPLPGRVLQMFVLSTRARQCDRLRRKLKSSRGRSRTGKCLEFGRNVGGLGGPDPLEDLQRLPQVVLGLGGMADGHGASA